MTGNHIAGLIGMVLIGVFIFCMFYIFWAVFSTVLLSAVGFLKWFGNLSVGDFFSHVGAAIIAWAVGHYYTSRRKP